MAESREVQRNRPVAGDLLANQATKIGLIGAFVFSTGQMIYDNRYTFVNVARFIFTQTVTFTKFVYRHIKPSPQVIPNIVRYPVNICRMSCSRHKAIKDRIVLEPWAKGREIEVNQESNTISVFDVDEEDQRLPVPLFYDEIPVIPHAYPFHYSDLHPKELNTPVHKVRDGLTREQLQKLREYFLGIITVDYYLDKHVAITIARQWYTIGLSKVGGVGFWAWGCFVVLLCAAEKQDVEIFHDIEDSEGTVSEDIVPGYRVYNENGEYSTVGAFLYKRSQLPTTSQHYPTVPINVDYFTVSAHSFVKKTYTGIGMNWRCALILAYVTHVAYVVMTQSLFNVVLIKQVLLVRLFVLFHDSVWIYAGRPCGLHTMRGKLFIEWNVPMIGLVAIYLVPLILRLGVCWYIEKTIPIIKGWGLFGVEWPMVLELVVTVWWNKFVHLMASGSDNVAPADNVRRWMYPYLRDTKGSREKLPFSYLIVSPLCFLGRWVLRYKFVSYGESIRFIGLLFFFWDLFQLFWSFDFPFTFSIIKQPIMDEHNVKIAEIVETYDVKASRFNPHRCNNDVARARFLIPRRYFAHQQIIWDDKPVTRDTKLVLLGTVERGYGDTIYQMVSDGVMGGLGGWRYSMDRLLNNKTGDYERDRVIIWRCETISLRGCSGGLLVRLENEKFIGVAFQSHEMAESFAPISTIPRQYWKIAYRVPNRLKEDYLGVAPL